MACPPLQKLRLDPENLAKMLLRPLLVWLPLWSDLVWWLLGTLLMREKLYLTVDELVLKGVVSPYVLSHRWSCSSSRERT